MRYCLGIILLVLVLNAKGQCKPYPHTSTLDLGCTADTGWIILDNSNSVSISSTKAWLTFHRADTLWVYVTYNDLDISRTATLRIGSKSVLVTQPPCDTLYTSSSGSASSPTIIK